ncbi:MAG: hypothetical protein OXE75_09830 [bacterium]|nr:hypothetical protein [bacterium]
MDGIHPGGGAAAIVTEPAVTSARNGARDAIGCAHMLCPEPATALLLFDARVTAAWLVDIEGRAWRGLPMCSAHANRFRPPVGWVLSDQRSRANRQRSGTESSAPEPAPSVTEPADGSRPEDPPPAPEPAPTPLLTRAFRTTAQASI